MKRNSLPAERTGLFLISSGFHFEVSGQKLPVLDFELISEAEVSGCQLESEVLSEVDFTSRFVVHQIIGRAFKHDFSFDEKGGAIDDVEGFSYLVVSD
jgi:hypothetical protein